MSYPKKGDALDPHVDNLRFERRRYGRSATYTWVYLVIGTEWRLLGDPWPCVTPKRSEVLREVQRITENQGRSNGN